MKNKSILGLLWGFDDNLHPWPHLDINQFTRGAFGWKFKRGIVLYFFQILF